MNRTLLLLGAAALFASPALAQEAAQVADVAPAASSEVVQTPLPLPLPEARGDTTLYNNGPLANSLGTAPGGGDESVITAPEGLFGYGAQTSAGNLMADDFTVPTGETWSVSSALVYTYQSNEVLPPTTITGANVSLHPDTGTGPDAGTVLCAGTFVGADTSNVFRNNDGPGGNTARHLQRVSVDFDESTCMLAEGTYWIAMQYEGTGASGPWQPPIPQPLGTTACEPVVGGAAQQSTGGGAFAVALNGACEADLPFVLYESGGVNPAVEEGPSSTTFALGAPRPNPTAHGTVLALDVEDTQHVRAEVFDALGRSVAVLFEGTVAAGASEALSLDTAKLPAGVYVVRVTGDSGWAARQVTVAH